MEIEKVKNLAIASLTALVSGIGSFLWFQSKEGADKQVSQAKSLAISGMAVGLGSILYNSREKASSESKNLDDPNAKWTKRITQDEKETEISY